MRTLASVAVASAVLTNAAPAIADTLTQRPVCTPRAEYVAYLKGTLNESQERVEMISDETILELFTSPAGTWTVITTSAGGLSCHAGAGEGLARYAKL